MSDQGTPEVDDSQSAEGSERDGGHQKPGRFRAFSRLNRAAKVLTSIRRKIGAIPATATEGLNFERADNAIKRLGSIQKTIIGLLIAALIFIAGWKMPAITEIIRNDTGWSSFNALVVLGIGAGLTMIMVLGLARVMQRVLGKGWLTLVQSLGRYLAINISGREDLEESELDQQAEKIANGIRAVLSIFFITFLLGLTSAFTVNLFHLAEFIGNRLQVVELQRQNEALVRQNRIAEIQQEFELTSSEADRAFNEVANILLNPEASYGQQIYALQQLPEAMIKPVVQLRQEMALDEESETNAEPVNDRITIYPNVAKLRGVLRQYMKDDRVGRALEQAGIVEVDGEPRSEEALRVLEKLGPVSNELMLALWSLGPVTEDESIGRINLWNWVPEDRANQQHLSFRTQGIRSPHERWNSFDGDLTHLEPLDFSFLQAPFFIWAPDEKGEVMSDETPDGVRFPEEANLDGADLSGANLRGADLAGANLAGAKLASAFLWRADLSGAWLPRADLAGAYLSEASLAGTEMSEADLDRANLYRANLAGAWLPRTNLSGSYLDGADLSGTDLRGADLASADLSGANLAGADMGEANLVGVNLSGANLAGADMGEANLVGVNLRGGDLSGVNLNMADLAGADLSRANLVGVNLRGGDLSGTDLNMTDLAGADLKGANLTGADLREANLTGADLREASIGGAFFLRHLDFNQSAFGQFVEVTTPVGSNYPVRIDSMSDGESPDTVNIDFPAAIFPASADALSPPTLTYFKDGWDGAQAWNAWEDSDHEQKDQIERRLRSLRAMDDDAFKSIPWSGSHQSEILSAIFGDENLKIESPSTVIFPKDLFSDYLRNGNWDLPHSRLEGSWMGVGFRNALLRLLDQEIDPEFTDVIAAVRQELLGKVNLIPESKPESGATQAEWEYWANWEKRRDWNLKAAAKEGLTKTNAEIVESELSELFKTVAEEFVGKKKAEMNEAEGKGSSN